MKNESSKKKYTTLKWEGGILETVSQDAILPKNKIKTKENPKKEPKKIEGRASLRLEKKGRGGSPVSVLYKFSDLEAKNKESLKQLCSQLKTKFACGGAVEDDEIILMIRDQEKLKLILKNEFNLLVN